MSCSKCGSHQHSSSSCGCSPCKADPANTAACETLPSQIENFTKQFFGQVIKTEVEGVVTWVLPCSLDVGLTNNPRGDGEGLACYFLRLFDEGITGLTGPQGDTGVNGADGRNAYTVTLLGFTQPTLAAPNVAVKTAYNPAIIPGLYVFIGTSGWYIVDAVDPATGVIFLTLTKPLSGASGVITAGKLVVPSGFPGQSIVGPTGAQGLKGDKGDDGDTFSSVNGNYGASLGSDYELSTVYTAINFINSSPQILLPNAGRYLVTATIGVIGQPGILSSDKSSFKLFNTSIAGDVANSEQEISNLISGQVAQVVIDVLVDTSAANQTVAAFGKCTTQGAMYARALFTKITFVRLT